MALEDFDLDVEKWRDLVWNEIKKNVGSQASAGIGT